VALESPEKDKVPARLVVVMGIVVLVLVDSDDRDKDNGTVVVGTKESILEMILPIINSTRRKDDR
jgi:hypothetical protein